MRSTNSSVPGKMASIIIFVVICATGAWTQTFKVLHNFGPINNDGFAPDAGLILDGNGNLYGTTVEGGSECGDYGCGTVFELTPNQDGSWSEAVIHSFNGNDGANPYAPVAFDSRGNLYGTTEHYGTGINGTLYELVPGVGGMWSEITRHIFSGGWDGGGSRLLTNAGVVVNSAGRLFGTTPGGGAYGGGVVYSLAGPSANGEIILHAFGHGNDGGMPTGLLTFDASGNIYGTAYIGGSNGAGIVFKLTPNRLRVGWTETVLYSFTGTPFGGGPDGANPTNGVVFDAAGNLYGTTQYGGNISGTVFELSPNPDGSWTESILHAFDGRTEGGNPQRLSLDNTGNIFSTNVAGGPYTYGTVFKLAPSSGGQWTITILHPFTSGLDGGWPWGGVVLDSSGNLYGTTVLGGTGGHEFGGVAFELTP